MRIPKENAFGLHTMNFENILTGYRPPTDNLWQAFYSMVGTFHNESINGWSMVAGVSLVTALCATKGPQCTSLQWAHALAMWVHLPLSFMYHATTCSKTYGPLFKRLDVTGVLIVSAVLTYTLCCVALPPFHPLTTLLVSCVLGLLLKDVSGYLGKGKGSQMAVGDKADRDQTLRKLAGAVACYNVPVFILLFMSPCVFVRSLCCVEIACVFGAVALYAIGFPECSFPARFDLVGSSHQLAHLLVIGQQVAIHYLGGGH